MHVFINQLIERAISFKRNLHLGWSLGFLFSYLAAWHKVEQNKRNHDPQVTNANKLRVSFNEMHFRAFVMGFVANQDVAVKNWWHFLSQLAVNVFETCKLSVSHHQTMGVRL